MYKYVYIYTFKFTLSLVLSDGLLIEHGMIFHEAMLNPWFIGGGSSKTWTES